MASQALIVYHIEPVEHQPSRLQTRCQRLLRPQE